MSPLGFGTTNTRAPASRSRFAPGPGLDARPKITGTSVTPTSATTSGCIARTFARSRTAPRASSVRVSSAAVAVTRRHTLTSAQPYSTSR
ncbi:MAG TPA: hypothetical protein VMJ10_27980 [Kofleriaceae bacterium]|nr:hypothetical protein [Kofleriaceae bacterium]